MTIEERLEKLECKLARAQFINRLLAVLGIGALLVMWFFASGTPTAQEKVVDEVRAKKFILEDENGEPRAKLCMNFLGEPCLILHEANGTERVNLAVFRGEPMLHMSDEYGKIRLSLGLVSVQPALFMKDENGQNRVELRMLGDNLYLGLFDKNGKIRASLGVDKDGPVLVMFDEKGKGIWQLATPRFLDPIKCKV